MVVVVISGNSGNGDGDGNGNSHGQKIRIVRIVRIIGFQEGC